MSKDRYFGVGITPDESVGSIERAAQRGIQRHLESSDIPPLRKIGYHIRDRMIKRDVTIQKLADNTGYEREDLVDIHFGSLPTGEILPKLNKLEEVLGFERNELLDVFNEIVGH